MVCAAKFIDDQWYRARVSGTPTSESVPISYIDYGNEAESEAEDLRVMQKKFMMLPYQVGSSFTSFEKGMSRV